MDANDFLISAQELIQGNREVDYRNAASRAYYCAFHLCLRLLEKLPHSQGNVGASHERVISTLLSHPDKKLKKIGRKLEQIKTLRHQADYKLHLRFYRSSAKQVIRHAHDISLDIEEFLQTYQDK